MVLEDDPTDDYGGDGRRENRQNGQQQPSADAHPATLHRARTGRGLFGGSIVFCLFYVLRRRFNFSRRVIFDFRCLGCFLQNVLIHVRGRHRILVNGLFLVIHRPKPFSWLFDRCYLIVRPTFSADTNSPPP